MMPVGFPSAGRYSGYSWSNDVGYFWTKGAGGNNEGQTQFVQVRQPDPAGVSVRIRHGDTVIEIDNQASESLLNFLKEVLIHAI
ncbi:MAG: hypothetical protein J5589_07585 [Firmicutes bacterium]|nr:hypothetical protein [Bacillota bacterium]